MEQDKHYSMIIIGAGITGLSTGLAWTKVYDPKEDPVLILERQAIPGGCVSTFAREGYRFDTVQIIPDVFDVLEFFEIDIELKRFETVYARLFLADPKEKNAELFHIGSDRDSFEAYLTDAFPEDADNIKEFFDYSTAMQAELQYLKTEPTFWQLFGILFNCPKIIVNSGKTYKEYLQKFEFKNQKVHEILDIFSSFSGLSGNRCASLLTACAMISTLQGSYRPKKGFIEFPHNLRQNFEAAGGEIQFKTCVEKILTENGKSVGVQLSDGRIIKSDYVVSTADTQITFGKMLGYDLLEKQNKQYARKAKEAVMSPSSMAIHLGLDGKLNLISLGYNCGYNVLTTGHTSHERMFDEWEKGNLYMNDDVFHLAVISPSVQTGGKQNIIIHVVPVAGEKWIKLKEEDPDRYEKEKNEVADFYINKVQEYMIPNLRNHIVYKNIASPATYARFIGSTAGCNFDMMPVPKNFGKNRLKTRTPIKNLFLPKFSHGIWPSMQAGLQVVDMISGGKIMKGNSSYTKVE